MKSPHWIGWKGYCLYLCFDLDFTKQSSLSRPAEQTYTCWLCEGSWGDRVCHFERHLFYIENGTQENSEHVRPKQAKLAQHSLSEHNFPTSLWMVTGRLTFILGAHGHQPRMSVSHQDIINIMVIYQYFNVGRLGKQQNSVLLVQGLFKNYWLWFRILMLILQLKFLDCKPSQCLSLWLGSLSSNICHSPKDYGGNQEMGALIRPPVLFSLSYKGYFDTNLWLWLIWQSPTILQSAAPTNWQRWPEATAF